MITGKFVWRAIASVPSRDPKSNTPLSKKICDLGVETIMLTELVRSLWKDESGQDIAEYAVMLAVILVIVVGTVRLIGSNANNVFSNVASSIQ